MIVVFFNYGNNWKASVMIYTFFICRLRVNSNFGFVLD